MDYIREKYWQAIDILVGTSALQERLTHAAQVLLRLKVEDFSDTDLARRHSEVIKALTETPLSNASSYQPRAMSDQEAEMLSREILSIYINVRGGI
ncbi:hypothetical protein [Bradyrhizobium elkanii]